MDITVEQLVKLTISEEPVEIFREILSITDNKEYGFGDSTIRVDNAKVLEVYESEFKGEKFYYLIINEMNEEMAFALSLYPTGGTL
jgi:hypothetical protein